MRPSPSPGRAAAVLLAAGAAAALAVTAGPDPAAAQQGGGNDILITLPFEFIESHKLKATVTVDMKVDKVGKVHKPDKDGEMHFAGRASQVQLPIVAELMNAGLTPQAAAVGDIHAAEGGGGTLPVTGAWRIWCEHAGSAPQTWGKKLSPFASSNPDHVFEIHPVTKVGTRDVRGSLGPIDGFEYKKPDRAFLHYENVSCVITPNKSKQTATIRTTMAGYNIPEFILEPLEGPDEHKVVNDGRFLMAAVHDLDGELLVRKLRMVFIKDTDVEKRIRTVPKGGRLHVIGMPRLNLSLVDFRIEHADDKDADGDPKYPDILRWKLPYEMIVVAGLEGSDDD